MGSFQVGNLQVMRAVPVIVQSIYDLILNKLQHKHFQQFLVQRNVLYNIWGESAKFWEKYS